ncbi:MAG: purine-nucleoside phosphorylase [candidate division Zixibacteria bacterium]|nr:purine-nucleoside phosphorylase [candidate division Zixibacteria bacterium]
MLTPKDVDVSYRYLRGKCELEPRVAVVLGSGIRRPALDYVCEVPFAEVPHLTKPTVEGHRGNFLFGRAGTVGAVVSEGRLHAYEGIPPYVATLPVRLFAKLGCRTLVTTGAAGSLREEFAPGNVALVRDHINLRGGSPLNGPHYEEFGPRFVAAADAYDGTLRARAKELAAALGFLTKEAVYVAVAGPQYETAAEVRALAALGGDVVGMSIPNEVLVARQAGLRVLALCAVTNVAGLAEVNHEEVLAGAEVTGEKIKALVGALLPYLGGR